MIMDCADIANKYIDEKAPWALVKENPEQAQIVCIGFVKCASYINDLFIAGVNASYGKVSAVFNY